MGRSAVQDFDFKTKVKEIYNFLTRETTRGDSRTKNGAVAEFFLCCLLRNNEYSQEYCIENLEENSIKKGFDGLYFKDNEIWIMESKSSATLNEHDNKHKGTINKAYDGIKKHIEGDKSVKNNPWKNAYTHAKVAGSHKTLTQKLATLSANFTNKNFEKIENHNIILGSTVITENIELVEYGLDKLENYITNHACKKELLIAINLKSINILLNYLSEVANG